MIYIRNYRKTIIFVSKGGHMKRKGMTYILTAEAAACVVFCMLQMNFSGSFSSLAAFPFEQTGCVLRYLSLSGKTGNISAIILYITLSLIPCLVWLILKKKEMLLGIDHILPGISVLLFLVNYYMINPGLFISGIPGMGKWMLGCTFYSVLSGYLVIRILFFCRRAEPEKLQAVLQGLLCFLNMVFVYLIFGQNLGSLLKSIQNVQNVNSGIAMDGLLFEAGGLGMTYLFFSFGYLVNILPYVFDIGIIFLSVRLLAALKADRYSEESAALADRLAGLCTKALCITAAADVAFNVLQVLFHGSLYQMDIEIHVPVISIVFVLAILLFARYMHEDQKLKQEHDLII